MSTKTKQTVRDIHNQQQSNGQNNESNLTQIVNILGGVDQILTDYLSESSNISISESQLTKLMQLLHTPHKYQQHIKSQPLTQLKRCNNSNNNEGIDPNDVYYYLDDKNTYLNALCGEAISDKLLQLLHNNIIRAIVLLSSILTLALEFFVMKQIWNIMHAIIMLTVVYPYAVLLMLSINKKGCKLILSTFEFWYKLSNVIVQAMCAIWIDLLGHHHHENDWILHTLVRIGTAMLVVVAVTYISCLDAYRMNNKWKIIFTSSMGILTFVGSMLWQRDWIFNPQNMYWIEIWIFSFSLQALRLTAWRVLTIFFWKQAIVSMIRYRNDKCVSIKYTPSIRWIRKMDNDQNTMAISSFSTKNKWSDEDLDDNDSDEMKIEAVPIVLLGRKYDNDDESSSSSSPLP